MNKLNNEFKQLITISGVIESIKTLKLESCICRLCKSFIQLLSLSENYLLGRNDVSNTNDTRTMLTDLFQTSLYSNLNR